ncbi:MAG TPA: type II secretion system protein GspL [Ideonella sp.]|nr:type II secretion system protein GspL [Ideonella sp.]
MSTLIVQLPAQPRLSAQRAEGPAAGLPRTPSELEYVFSADGQQITQHGRCAPRALPKAQSVVAVLPAEDVAWHLITAPKAPAARLRPALVGILEESLLQDESELHLAVAPGLKPGEPLWVAAVAKPWLAAQIEVIEATGLTVDRLVPAWGPDDSPAGHVYTAEAGVTGGTDDGLWLAWRDAKGPLCLPLASDATRALLAGLPPDQPVHWTASPEGAAEAARLAGTTVAAQSQGDFLLAASKSGWNLRQFDLAAQRRGSRVAREWLQRFWQDRAWRPVRYGLALLVVVQLLGINLWAWQQRQALARQKIAMTSLLQTTFPQVRAVIDAPAQMQKEVDLLRTAAGKPADTDLEPMLYAAEAAWPGSRAPADALKYEPGKLTINSVGWSPQEVDEFRGRLRPLGLDAEAVPGRLTLSRARVAEGTPPLNNATGGLPPGTANPAAYGSPPGAPRPLAPQTMQGQPAAGQMPAGAGPVQPGQRAIAPGGTPGLRPGMPPAGAQPQPVRPLPGNPPLSGRPMQGNNADGQSEI